MLLGWATIGAYGAVYYSFGVLLQPVREATGWSVSALTAGFSAGVLLGGAGGVLAGRALDRIGPRPVLGVALGLGCTALLGASYAPELWHFMASWAIGAGAVAGGLYYHVTMAVTARLYPERRAAAFSILTLFGALAGPIFYPLAGWLVEAFEWRTAMRFLVLALAVTTLPSVMFVRSDRGSTKATERPRAPASLARLLRNPRVFLVFTMIGSVSLGTSALTLHQVPAMQATGLSLAAASAIAGTRGLFQFGGRLFLAPLVTRIGVAGAVAACYAASAVGTGLLAGAGSIVLVIGFIGLTGIALGLLSPLHGLFGAEVYGDDQLGTLMGVQQVVASVCGAAGPWLAGVALDSTGSYLVVLVAAALLQAGGLVPLVLQRNLGHEERLPASAA